VSIFFRDTMKVKAGANRTITKQELKKRKEVPHFKRFQSWRHVRVRESWRKPRGIDSALRRGFRGYPAKPCIGYKQTLKLRHVHPNGKRQFLVKNVRDLEMLMMHNKKYAAVIGHAVGARKRKLIVTRAKELQITLTNGTKRLRAEENE